MAKLTDSTDIRTRTPARVAERADSLGVESLLVAIFGLCAFLPGLGSYKMLDPTDSFFVEAAREMHLSQHYITPLFNYADWLDKPALPFLLIVACYKIFGVSEWAARLPSALSAVFLVVATFRTTARFFSRRVAIFAALILSALPLFSIVGHLALSDEPLAMVIGVALLYFARALIDQERPALFVAYLSLAFSMLLKGPIGLVLSLAVILIFLAACSASPGAVFDKLRSLKPVAGAGIILLLCLPYYLIAHLSTNGAFTSEFFLHQNLGRFEGTVNHQQPFWWYVPVVLGGFFPASLLLLSSGAWLRSLWQQRRQSSRQEAFLIFCAIWALVVFALFSAIPTKLPTYIAPMSPALAILAAAYLGNLAASGRSRTLLVCLVAVIVLAVGALIVIGTGHFGFVLAGPLVTFASALTIATLVLSLILLVKRRAAESTGAFVAASYLAVSMLLPLGMCQFYEWHQAGIDRLVKTAKDRGASLATLFSTVPSAVFHYQSKIENLNSLAEIGEFSRQGSRPHYLLATGNCLKIAELNAAERTVDRAGKWYLLCVDDFPGAK